MHTISLRSFMILPQLIDRKAAPALVLLGAFAIVVVVGVAAGVIGPDDGELAPVFAGLAAVYIGGAGFEALGQNRLGDALKALSAYMILGLVAMLASAVLAVISADYSDSAFLAADRFMFAIDWQTDIPAMTQNREIGLALSHAYASLTWQPFLMLGYLIIAGKSSRCWKAITATALALAICIGVFPFCPAEGGYVHCHIDAASVPNVRVLSAWHYPVILHALKEGKLNSLGSGTLEGIVAMPSFHASAAVILAWALWATRLRWPFLILNAVMLVSAVPIGGHYVVDVIAGAALAFFAIWWTLKIHGPCPKFSGRELE
jgi:membrane-associated phospholipid phosphatase